MAAAELKKDIAYPLSNDDIAFLLPGVPITTYPSFGDAPALEQVVDAHGRGIVLFLKSATRAHLEGHWLAVLTRPDRTVLLFDPYGGTDEPWELDHKFVSSAAALEKLGQEQPLMAPYFEGHGYEPVYNETRLQTMAPRIATCGRHCVVRLWRADLDDDAYVAWLEGHAMPPDGVVTQLTESALDKSNLARP